MKIIDFERLGEMARQAQGGDSAAYEAFLEALYPYVHGIVRSRVGDWLDIDDVTQECLLGIHKSFATWHPSKSIKPWIHAIVRYKLVDYFRAYARKRESVTSTDILERTPEGAGHPDDGAAAPAPDIDVHQLLGRLPEALRRAVAMTKLEGLSTDEAARREGINGSALRKRISRAYRKMGKMVEQDLKRDE